MFLTCGSASFVSSEYGNGMCGNRPGGMQCGSKPLLFTFQKADRFLRIPSDKESHIISSGSTKQPLYFSDSACNRRSNRICHCAATDFWRRMGNSQF